MEIDDDAIREFMVLWEQEFKERISEEEARRYAALVLELYTILARPDTQDQQAGDCPPSL